jgi:hypothetical protein
MDLMDTEQTSLQNLVVLVVVVPVHRGAVRPLVFRVPTVLVEEAEEGPEKMVLQEDTVVTVDRVW